MPIYATTLQADKDVQYWARQTSQQSHQEPDKNGWHKQPCTQLTLPNFSKLPTQSTTLQQHGQQQIELAHPQHHKQHPPMRAQAPYQKPHMRLYGQLQHNKYNSMQTVQLEERNPNWLVKMRKRDSRGPTPPSCGNVWFTHPFKDGGPWKHYAPRQKPQTAPIKSVTWNGDYSWWWASKAYHAKQPPQIRKSMQYPLSWWILSKV